MEVVQCSQPGDLPPQVLLTSCTEVLSKSNGIVIGSPLLFAWPGQGDRQVMTNSALIMVMAYMDDSHPQPYHSGRSLRIPNSGSEWCLPLNRKMYLQNFLPALFSQVFLAASHLTIPGLFRRPCQSETGIIALPLLRALLKYEGQSVPHYSGFQTWWHLAKVVPLTLGAFLEDSPP